jgi:hypothetical protein
MTALTFDLEIPVKFDAVENLHKTEARSRSVALQCSRRLGSTTADREPGTRTSFVSLSPTLLVVLVMKCRFHRSLWLGTWSCGTKESWKGKCSDNLVQTP